MNALIEPFYFCLILSMIWAPLVFLAANHFKKDEARADKIWSFALLVAALPALAAPFAAYFGLSLRQAAPLPPLAETQFPAAYDAMAVTGLTPAPAYSISMTSILEAGAVLYFYGFLMFLVLGLIRHVWFAYRVNYAYDLDEPKLQAALEDWRIRMGLKSAPRYAFSDVVSSVCVHGFFRPVVLMPEGLLDRLSLEDAALMGAHEMAHIKRGDTALFAFCTAVRAIFWFNPFMQRIAARANLAAEQAADALVIASGVDRRQYAHCFVQGLKFAAGSRFAGRELVPSFTPFDKRSRRERLDAILSGVHAPLLTMPGKIGMMLSIILAAGLAFVQAALAVAPRPAEDALPKAPVEGDITMKFKETSKLLGKDRVWHEGIDIKASRGTPVQAAGDGKVIAATDRYNGQKAWGNVVVIDHGHGLVTRYAHLDSYLVRKGDSVKAGDVIGAVGSSGKASGPHLHFEVIRDGTPIDPAPVVAAEALPAPAPLIAEAPRPVIATNLAPAPKLSGAPETPEAAPSPEAAPEPSDPKVLSWEEKLERRLEGRREKLKDKQKEFFKNFEDFGDLENFAFEFGDLEMETLKGTAKIADAFKGFEIDPKDLQTFKMAMPNVGTMSFHMMSEEEVEELKRTQEEAMERAKEAMERSREERERVMEEFRRNHERAMEEAERRREEAAERAEERAEREEEARIREEERAEREHARAVERAERAQERAQERAERKKQAAIDEAELLSLRAEAIKEAQQDLNEQLAEIERRRKELERERATRERD